MITSRIPAAIDYLVTTFQAAATLGLATPPVTVLDGTVVTADAGPLALWVGTGDINPSSGAPQSASSRQAWQPGMGRTNRAEQITIYCTAQASSGSDDVRTLRVAAAAIVAAAEALVSADPSLGGTLPGCKDAVVATADWRQGPTPRGMGVQVMFTIDASAIVSTS